MQVQDPTASSRKKDHIELAFESQVRSLDIDPRFDYEPVLSAHPEAPAPVEFLGKQLSAPIWVSSMTGGTEMARKINHRLAKACAEFGMGMGLGSCRSLLDSDEYFEDFNVRPVIGDAQPLFANLGIAQVEELIARRDTGKVVDMLGRLWADGLFIHINPLQEWLQPEGDLLKRPPLDTIAEFLEMHPDVPVIAKEVGQGMGPASLLALMQLPLAAIEFAAHGGTNFSKLELLRSDDDARGHFREIARIGHSAEDMTDAVNRILKETSPAMIRCKHFIISGGVRNFLDGYYLRTKLKAPSVYGQASAMLRHAAESYEDVQRFVKFQLKGYALAEAYLRLRK